MEQQFITIEQLHNLLNEWHGKPIQVEKLELHDQDIINIQLNGISYEKNTRKLDDYEATYTLKLNGVGHHVNDEQSIQPLPENVYEIPIEDTSLYEYNGRQFILSTDRGIYKITLT